AAMLLAGCNKAATTTTSSAAAQTESAATSAVAEQLKEQPLTGKPADDNFEYIADQFADLRILRYQVPGFEKLNAQDKELLYYLYEAALSGRDISYDQNFKHNLRIRRTLDAIVENQQDKKVSQDEWPKCMTYTKRGW